MTRVRFTGSGREVELRIPADGGNARATLNGEPVAVELSEIQGDDFWCLAADPSGVNVLEITPE